MNLKVLLLFYVEEQKEENQSQMGTFALGKRRETNGRLGNGPPFQNRLGTVRFVLELGVLESVGDRQDCFHLPLSSFHPSVLSSDGSGSSGHVIPAELQNLGGVP